MKESLPGDIMLCFVQGFGNEERQSCEKIDYNNSIEIEGRPKKKLQTKKVSIPKLDDEVEIRPKRKANSLISGKSLRLSSGEQFLKDLPEVKRSFSDRFTVLPDVSGKRPKRLLTIRKTWSTGNFAAGAAGGGCGTARSAPATPLQLEPPHRTSKHDKQAVKPLSTSSPSVRVSALSGGADVASDASDGKAPSKARQKKFLRHFPQVGPEERVLNYYSCALVGDILLQGHLYITKNYFAFYSNVFGYVTKLLIPTVSVVRVSKEKMARIIPNAVGVCTRDERHVFGSLLSRDSTYKLMTRVWKGARVSPPPPTELRISEVEVDASEYSPEDESSSAGGGDNTTLSTRHLTHRPPEAIVTGPSTAVIQPALITGGGTVLTARTVSNNSGGGLTRILMICVALMLAFSAIYLSLKILEAKQRPEQALTKLSGEELYSELVRWRSRLHGRAASELQAFLSTNLLLLTKVRLSLEALSGVILTDMGNHTGHPMDDTQDTSFS